MSRGGIESREVGGGEVALGGNEYCTVYTTITPGGYLNKGQILVRIGGGDDVEEANKISSNGLHLINPFRIENKTNSTQRMSLRAIVSGPVRADLLRINSEPHPTIGFLDELRRSSIIPVQGHDISRTE